MSLKNIYEILACPVCNIKLNFPSEDIEQINNDGEFLKCPECESIYSIRNTIPILLSKNNDYTGMNYIEHYQNDAEYFDYFEERDCKATEHDEKRLQQYILSKVKREDNLILDVGSGGAWLAKKINFNFHTLLSFDISEKNISGAIKEFPNEKHFGVVGDALQPPFLPDSFDCIIASEIIEHLVLPQDFINNMLKLLKPGGTLIISTPYKEKIQFYLCIHCNKMTPKNAHLHSFDEKKLLSYFAGNNNFETHNKKNSNGKFLQYFIFGNKVLTVLRTHIFLKLLPFPLWKIVDKISNLIVNKPAHIVIVYRKNYDN